MYDSQNKNKTIFKGIYTSPAWIKVPKDHFHDILALEDSLGYCIQAIHNENGEVVATDYANDEDWMEEVKQFERKTKLVDEEKK